VLKASSCWRESLSLSPRITGKDRVNVALAFAFLAQARVTQGDLDEGETLYRSAIDDTTSCPALNGPKWPTRSAIS